MAEVTERDKELAFSATSGEGLGSAVLDRIERACAEAREEGRQLALQDAKAACREGVAGEEAKAMGFKSWFAELCINAIEALEAQDG